MTEPSLSADELAALRRRWEQGATPQLALQLAEEYTRLSEHDLAVAVLEKAVGDNPSHLAVRVAAGRLRLELGDLDAAASDLEDVVERDPTHLVANKLLVRVYSGRGEPQRARDRLDLYCLLNESDPEIEDLEALVPPEGLVVASTAATEEGAEGEPAAEAGTLPEGGAPLDADLELAPAAAPVPRNEAPRDEEAPPVAESAPAGGEEPFPGLWDDLDTAGYWHQVEDGQILGGGSEPAPRPPSDAAAAARSVPQPTEADVQDETETDVVDATMSQTVDTPEAVGSTEETAVDPSEETAVDPSAVEEGQQPWPGQVAAIAEPEPVRGAEAEAPAPREAAQAEERGRAASVTLADLYHQQGHLEEARRTYWQVLEREPSNREALEGLVRLARSGSSELTAFDLLGDEIPGTPAARRRRVLEGYLARLGRGESDVV